MPLKQHSIEEDFDTQDEAERHSMPLKQHSIQQPLSAVKALSYEKIVVRADRIELMVRVSSPECRMTNGAIIDACLKDFPELAAHACHNAKGPTFASVMYHTSLPHLLEHLIVNAQLRAHEATFNQHDIAVEHQPANQHAESRGDPARNEPYNLSHDLILTGTTQFGAEDPLLAKVSVSFKDDLVGLAACKEMLAYLNDVVSKALGR